MVSLCRYSCGVNCYSFIFKRFLELYLYRYSYRPWCKWALKLNISLHCLVDLCYKFRLFAKFLGKWLVSWFKIVIVDTNPEVRNQKWGSIYCEISLIITKKQQVTELNVSFWSRRTKGPFTHFFQLKNKNTFFYAFWPFIYMTTVFWGPEKIFWKLISKCTFLKINFYCLSVNYKNAKEGLFRF